MNYSSNEVNGSAVAAILTIEMVCGLTANGSNYNHSNKILDTTFNNVLHFSHTGSPCNAVNVSSFLYHILSSW